MRINISISIKQECCRKLYQVVHNTHRRGPTVLEYQSDESQTQYLIFAQYYIDFSRGIDYWQMQKYKKIASFDVSLYSQSHEKLGYLLINRASWYIVILLYMLNSTDHTIGPNKLTVWKRKSLNMKVKLIERVKECDNTEMYSTANRERFIQGLVTVHL